MAFYYLATSRHLQTYPVLKAAFETSHVKILSPYTFVVDYDDDKTVTFTSAQGLKQKYANIRCDTDVKFIDQWLSDPYIRTCSSVDFSPPPLTCDADVLNTWRGFAIDDVTINQEECGDVSAFLDHVDILGRTVYYFVASATSARAWQTRWRSFGLCVS